MIHLNMTMAEYDALYDAIDKSVRPAVFAEQSPYVEIGQYHSALAHLFGTDVAQQLLDYMRRRECVRVVVVRDTPHTRITPSP